ncbi:MAG: hypothetical protein FJZ63_00980 [Chlamydiae bacterium]|nr:hypothetical protein [Chlamydiota bacterium]
MSIERKGERVPQESSDEGTEFYYDENPPTEKELARKIESGGDIESERKFTKPIEKLKLKKTKVSKKQSPKQH